MNLLCWLGFAAIIWIGGYGLARLSTRENLASREVFIITPKWLYLLCGQPKGKDLPSGVMLLRAFYFQLCGLMMAAFGFIFGVLYPPEAFDIFWFLLGWIGSLFLAAIVCLVYSKMNGYLG